MADPLTCARPEAATDLHHCTLCGHDFAQGGVVCGACPMSSGCDLVRCPRCGFQFPRRSALVDAWRRVLTFLRRPA